MEFFDWRDFKDREELGFLAGLATTPFEWRFDGSRTKNRQARQSTSSHGGNRERFVSVDIAAIE
jgi:hypothetical protein